MTLGSTPENIPAEDDRDTPLPSRRLAACFRKPGRESRLKISGWADGSRGGTGATGAHGEAPAPAGTRKKVFQGADLETMLLPGR
jgi:hypothetical protein